MLGLAVMGAVLYTLFQKSAPAFGLFVSMGAAVLVLWKISTAAQTVLSGLIKLEQRAGGDAFSCLLRCTGVILLADYARALCEEAGAESLAWCTALAGRVLVLAAALAGLFGILAVLGLAVWYLCTIDSDGVAYMAPFVDSERPTIFRTLLRRPQPDEKFRPPEYGSPNRRRQR